MEAEKIIQWFAWLLLDGICSVLILWIVRVCVWPHGVSISHLVSRNTVPGHVFSVSVPPYAVWNIRRGNTYMERVFCKKSCVSVDISSGLVECLVISLWYRSIWWSIFNTLFCFMCMTIRNWRHILLYVSHWSRLLCKCLSSCCNYLSIYVSPFSQGGIDLVRLHANLQTAIIPTHLAVGSVLSCDWTAAMSSYAPESQAL